MSPDGSPARPPWQLFAVAALLCVGLFVGELYFLSGETGFPLDDSWIHLQFARNLADGEGLSYNAGELVTGSTAPLWTALASTLFLLPGSPVVWLKLLGALLYLAGLLVTYFLARELGLGDGLASLAAWLTLGTSWLVWSAISGLEIPLFVLLSVGGIVWHLRERRRPELPPRSLVVLAVSALARPEGLLLLLLVVFDRWLVVEKDDAGEVALQRPEAGGRREGSALAVVAAAAAVLPVAVFNQLVGGSPLPTTFGAKVVGESGLLPDAGYLYTVLGIFFRPQPVLLLTCGAGALVLIERLGGERDRGLLPVFWLVGLPLAFSAISPAVGPPVVGNFGRYLFPLLPVVVVLGVLGLERVWRALGSGLSIGGLRPPLRALLLVVLVVPTALALIQGAGRYLQSVGNVHDSDVRVARWLDGRLPDGAVLAVNDIGAIKYLLPEHEVLDLAGIAHPEVRRYMLDAVAAGQHHLDGVSRFLEKHRPDYLVVFPKLFPSLGRDPESFRPLHEVEIADNITMGGDRIVVYSTPWTRAPLRSGDE